MAERAGQGPVDSAAKRGSTISAADSQLDMSRPRDPITSPSAESPVAFLESVWMQIALELEDRLKRPSEEDDEERNSSLAVRLAMMAELLGIKADEAERFLDLASEHPLVPRLGWVRALERASEEELKTVELLVDGLVVDRDEKSFLLRDISEAWLYRFGHAGRAARAARSGLDTVVSLTSEVALELRELFFLSLAVAEEWSDYVGFLAQSVATAEEIDQVERISMFIEAVHTSLDWLDRPDNAAKLVRRRFDLLGELPSEPASRALYLHAIDLALDVADAASARHRIDRKPLLERRLQLALAADDDVEVAITQLLLANELREKGETEGLYELFEAIPPAGSWAEHFRNRELARSAVAAARWPDALRALDGAAQRESSLASSYRCRLAELAEMHQDESYSATAQWQAVRGQGISSPQVFRRLESVLLRRDDGGLVEFLDGLAGENDRRRLPMSRRGYLRALRNNPSAPTKRLANALPAETEPDKLWECFLVARMSSRGAHSKESASLFASIGDTALAHLDNQGKKIGPALLSHAGLIDLACGDVDGAIARLAKALAADPADLGSALVLAALYRQQESWQELASTLERIAAEAVSGELLTSVLRELANVLGRRLGAPKRARRALESALKIAPDDAAVIRQLAEISDSEADWERSVELRSKAVALGPGQSESADLLVEIGTIEEERQRDDDALAAFERALEIDPRSLGALRGAARILRRRREYADLLAILRREVELIRTSGDISTIQLDIARTLTSLGAETGEILEAHRAAVVADPENDSALFALVDAARRSERFDLVVEGCQLAPKTPRNLGWLCEALAHQSRWQELVEHQQELVKLVGDSEKVSLLCEIARVQLEELLNSDAAALCLRQALEIDPKNKRARAALDEILGSESDSQTLEAEWEAEIQKGLEEQPERKFVLHLRLGKARELRGDIAAATEAYEGARAIHPDHKPTLEVLSQIYEKQERPEEWLDVVSSLAVVAENARERSALYRSIAERLAPLDPERTVEAWNKALIADPTDREVFTAAEAYCYETESWGALMGLYNHCIHLTEEGGLRAYRLADLYNRRGLIEDRYLGNNDVAAATYSMVLELEPDDIASIEQLENLFARTGDWSALIASYSRLTEITSEPELRVEACRRAARVASGELRDEELAGKWYLRVLEADPDDEEALSALEESATAAGDWGRLIEVLRKRLECAPAGNRTTYLLSRIAKICEQKLFDDERAITYYQRILETSPGHRGALESLARIYESTERWADFVEVTKRQIKVTRERSQKALLYFRCGSVMEAKFGEEDEAVRYYQAAIKTSPTCMPAVHGLRDVWRRRNDWPRVVQTLELEVKLWDSDRERAGVFAQIGNVYANELGDRERAHHYFESALAVDPDCIPANRALFDAFFQEHDWQRALPLSDLLAQRSMREGDPVARADFYYKRGVVCSMVGDGEEAAESTLTSLEIRSDNPEALESLNRIAREYPGVYDFQGTFAELRRLYRNHEDSNTLEARVIVGESIVLEGAGDLEGARDLLEEALRIAPSDPAILADYVDLQLRRRLFDDAERVVLEFLARAEHDLAERTAVNLIHARLLADYLGKDGEAVTKLATIVEEDESSVEARYRLAQLYFQGGRYAEAQALIENVIALEAAPGRDVLASQLSRYYFFLGHISEQLGNERAALTSYRRAADYDPGYAAPNLALAKRAAFVGDTVTAQSILFNAAHQAIGSVNKEAAVPLQRGLARLQSRAGEGTAAIDAYRGMLSVAPGDFYDRFELACLYRKTEPLRAVREFLRVIDHNVRAAPAYSELAACYREMGLEHRAARVEVAQSLLMLSEGLVTGPNAAPLPEKMIDLSAPTYDDILIPGGRSPRRELLSAICRYFEGGSQVPARVPQAAAEVSAELQQLIDRAGEAFSVSPAVLLADEVPFLVEVEFDPDPVVILDRQAAEVPAQARFLLGYAFAAIGGGFGLLLRRSRRVRRHIAEVVDAARGKVSFKGKELLERIPDPSGELRRGLSKRDRRSSSDMWIDAQLDSARRAGLIFADDLSSTAELLTRISGWSELVSVASGAAALLSEKPDVLRFYLSEGYDHMHLRVFSAGPASAE